MPALETLVNNLRRDIFVPGIKVISMKSGGGTTRDTIYTIKSYYDKTNVKLKEIDSIYAPLMSRFKKADI